MKKFDVLAQLSIVLFAIFCRLLPHPANVAPIAAMALFGGAHLSKRYALVLPLLAMVVSDIFLGFHNTIFFVYSSFLLTGLLGLWLRSHRNPTMVFFASLLSSVLFFTITNLGDWLMGAMYPHTLSGLVTCYMMGIPFFRNTLLGDLFYTGVLFGGYAVLSTVLLHKRIHYDTSK